MDLHELLVDAQLSKTKSAEPRGPEAGNAEMADPEELRRKERAEYRIQAQGVMLTYNSFADQLQH